MVAHATNGRGQDLNVLSICTRDGDTYHVVRLLRQKVMLVQVKGRDLVTAIGKVIGNGSKRRNDDTINEKQDVQKEQYIQQDACSSCDATGRNDRGRDNGSCIDDNSWFIMLICLKLFSRYLFMRLAELIEEALMTNTEVAQEAKLSPGTISRMVNGHLTSRLSVRKVLTLLSRKLGRKIEIEDVEGLNLSD